MTKPHPLLYSKKEKIWALVVLTDILGRNFDSMVTSILVEP